MEFDDLSIEQLEKLLAKKKEEQNRKNSEPLEKVPWESPVGVWEVATEGDCEGRSIRELGIHKGHIVDIAHDLGGHAMYSLHFTKAKKQEIPIKEAEAVNLQLNIETRTWDVSNRERVKMLREFLLREKSNNQFITKQTNNYASVMLEFK